jgi:hypothetical protein
MEPPAAEVSSGAIKAGFVSDGQVTQEEIGRLDSSIKERNKENARRKYLMAFFKVSDMFAERVG